ncbi:MAG: nucleotidyltransferase domain-containing protein [Chloroflexota bacterium]
MVASKSKIRKIVNEFVQALEPDIKVERVILYGSYAQGKANKWSDIDVAVLSPTFAEMPDLIVIEEIARRRIHCDSRLSPFAYTPSQFDNALPYMFAAEIRRTGKVVYDARKRKKRVTKRKVGR